MLEAPSSSGCEGQASTPSVSTRRAVNQPAITYFRIPIDHLGLGALVCISYAIQNSFSPTITPAYIRNEM